MPTSTPEYDFQDFQAECGKKNANVYYWGEVGLDAKFFKLYGRKDILAFIAKPKYISIVYINTVPLRQVGRDCGVLIDAYEFNTSGQRGYLAFFKAKTGKWIIKSLHSQEEKTPLPSLNKTIIREAFLKAGISENDFRDKMEGK